jgi:hypothetical protein
MKKAQLDIIELLEQARPDINLKSCSTPATTGTTLKKNEGKIIQESDYRLVVGKVLHLTTKVAQFLDSDYARWEETRRSLLSQVNMLGGVLLNTTSKKQGSVTLSNREAELVAGIECANEAMFQSMLLEEMLGRKVQATILINNKGAIFMVKNHKVGSRTRHIQVQHLYMRELQERGRVKVELIPTAQNVSNIGAKNLAEKLFDQHTNRVLDGRILECLREDVKMYNVSEGKSSN